ncbi:MAG: fibronectin type III domain-containing protein, partial [Eubacterium sp.]
TLYFTIKPKATSISSVSAGSKKFTVKWKKQSTQVTGYQIQYSTSSKFTSPKYVTVSSNKTTSKTISKLKSKKKYYVRVRTYKTVSGTKYYSSWSKAKSVTTKK